MDERLTEAWRSYIFDRMLEFCDTEDNPEALRIGGGEADEQDPDWFPFDVFLSGAEENWAFSAARVDNRERPVVKGAFLQPWDGDVLQVVVIDPAALPASYLR